MLTCTGRLKAYRSAGRGCEHPCIPKLKEESRVLPTYDHTSDNGTDGWKPKGQAQTRLQTLVMTLADIGARIDEVLRLGLRSTTSWSVP